MNLLFALMLSYLLGSIPFSQIVAKLAKGIDLRKAGTGNVGGNNLIQTAGASWGVIGGGLDILKGAAAMWAAQTLGAPYPASLAAGVAVVAGHNWPIWLGFRGGKGLATAGGALAWITPLEAIACMALWALVTWRTGNATNATIAGFGALGVIYFLQSRPLEFFLLGLALVALVFIATARDLAAEARTRGGWKNVLVSHKTEK